MDASYRILNDIGFDELPRTLSKASDNFVKRDVRELVGTLANPRPIVSFKCDNQEYKSTAEVLNKLYLHWYQSSFADRTLREALQYAAVEGTGYLCMEWDPGFWSPSEGDIKIQALGVDAVLPIQISPEDWDLQNAYAVIIRRQYPITQVLKRFPLAASIVTPDGESISKWRRLVNGMMDKVTATVQNTYGTNRGYRGEDPFGRQLVTVYDVYIMDNQVNIGPGQMTMGVDGSPWAYTVPAYHQPIPIGMNDPNTMMPITRPADLHDARMFPYRRHIVATRTAVLYDDTSRWWHGRVPLVKFRLDDWPFEYCGMPITKEPGKLQAMMTSLLRAYDDSSNARLRPGLVYDKTRVSEQQARQFDPRVGGQVIAATNLMGEMFKMAVDPRSMQMQSDILPLIEYVKESGSKLMGLHDLVAMSKAAQVPGADTIEKLAEMAGPIATDMSRNMEAGIRDLGELWKCNTFEFYNVRKRYQILGADGMTYEDFDFDPGTLVPSNIDPYGRATRADRARLHMRNFHFSIVPNSIYQMTQSSRRLLLLQLARMGMPIPSEYLMEQFDLPNPEELRKKFYKEKLEEGKYMIEIQMELSQQQLAMGMLQNAASPIGQMSAAIQQHMAQRPGQGQVGRPPSGQVPPHVEEKTDGTGVPVRSTISES